MQPPCRKGCLAFRRVLMAPTLFWMWSTPKRTLRCAISYTCAYIINSPQETRRRDPNPKGMPCTDYVRTILYHRYMLKLHTYTRCSYMYHNMISFTSVSCIPIILVVTVLQVVTVLYVQILLDHLCIFFIMNGTNNFCKVTVHTYTMCVLSVYM